ncbi:MAG: DNA repair protein RecN, partial [Trichococcus sp.]
MLQELSIKNFAIIENLQVSFDEGMTVLTGETGAGKSIIIDAVGLLAGGRGSNDLIRYGENKTVIQGLFSIPENAKTVAVLESYGIEADGNQVLLQRELSRNGKNISRVNGTIVTVATLREVGETLIDIHGQNEHQELMDPQKHIDLLDQFAGNELREVKMTYLDTYATYMDTRKQLIKLKTDEKETVQRIDLLTFQIQEIEQAQLKDPAEDEKLEEERNLLVNYQKVMQALTSAYDSMQNSEENGIDKIGLGMAALEKVQDINPAYQTIASSVSAAYYQLQECAGDILSEIEQLSYDEGRLNEIENRLELIRQLKRKYGNTISEVLGHYEKISQELDLIENRETYLEKLNGDYNKAKEEILAIGKQLTVLREKAAVILEEQIQLQLKELYMEKVLFKTVFHAQPGKIAITDNGLDHVEFYIATNVGEPLKALAKVASGGELSRMMLAMKAIFTKTQGITSIIFDEVDTGVSGRVAQAIANKIHLVASYSQVLC